MELSNSTVIELIMAAEQLQRAGWVSSIDTITVDRMLRAVGMAVRDHRTHIFTQEDNMINYDVERAAQRIYLALVHPEHLASDPGIYWDDLADIAKAAYRLAAREAFLTASEVVDAVAPGDDSNEI